MVPDYQDERYFIQNCKHGTKKGKDLESGQKDIDEPLQSQRKLPGLC